MTDFICSIPGLDVRELDLDLVVLGGPEDADFNDDLGPCFEDLLNAEVETSALLARLAL